MLISDFIRNSVYVGLKLQKLLLGEILMYDVVCLFLLAGLDVAVEFAMDLLLTCKSKTWRQYCSGCISKLLCV